ncbi:uncharacterized protein LOC103149166 [Poecilia formosa]|uniref:uncharacterized protein LOC103149166 n=1 Tax=Poecilia formosa TaxID=48698 RepID=UPI0004439EAA|nr:PREDICTED: uncharacterized protein LOC103149166 [Poecilia formosa]
MLSFSSASNDSVPDPHVSAGHPYICFYSGPGRIIFTVFKVVHVVTILPLCTFILYLGLQQMQKKTPASSAATSHCDVFTYHIVAMELIGVIGFFLSFFGNYMDDTNVFIYGFMVFSVTAYGQIFFHMLTSVERYLAAVHPVSYLGLKNEKGVRIRNVTVVWVWLLCFASIGYMTTGSYIILDTFLNVLATAVIFFCCVSVLFALIRPGPGRKRPDQSKQRAFCTILVILGVLMVRLSFGLVWVGLDLTGNAARCLTMVCTTGVNLPSSLVLPLLFLHRAGKLACCIK